MAGLDSSNKTYIIYMHKNKINNKVYIGQTSTSVEKRWQKGKGYKSCFLFNRAIEKYGWENFEHTILYEGLTSEQANEKEIELITKYKSNNPNYGYNIQNGGTKSSLPIEQRQRMSEAQQGNGNRNIPVMCIETGEVFQSAVIAAKRIGQTDGSIIGKCCRGTVKNTGGYTWRFLTKEEEKNIDILLLQNKNKTKQRMVYCPELDKYFISAAQAKKELSLSSRIPDVLRGEKQSCGRHPVTNKPLHWKWVYV